MREPGLPKAIKKPREKGGLNKGITSLPLLTNTIIELKTVFSVQHYDWAKKATFETLENPFGKLDKQVSCPSSYNSPTNPPVSAFTLSHGLDFRWSTLKTDKQVILHNIIFPSCSLWMRHSMRICFVKSKITCLLGPLGEAFTCFF